MHDDKIAQESAWAPLSQVLARRLQSMILSGELPQGARIPSQRVLSQRFEVSRASLREALLTLETLGLVRTEPGRGTFVAPQAPAAASSRWRYADSHSLHDVFETRLMLEGRIAEAAATQIEGVPLDTLTKATNEMEQCWEAGDLLANVEADLLFHLTIARSCPNRMLLALYEAVTHLLTETQRQPIPRTEPRRMAASLSEHRLIVAALQKHDPIATRLAMESHVRNTARCAGIEI
jgi:GntR family transcriptional repressor for pyruvate dehydrogenase complex